jgi:hypothetical protein
MPVVRINVTPPTPEGEYAGVLTKVSSGYTQKTNELRFTYDIKMKDGRVIKDALYFGEKVGWRIVQLAKSADLVLPENYETLGIIITTDDLEGRTVYFGVKHNPGENGRMFTNINYHAMSYAIQQNPTLAGMYPPQTPRHLRAAPPEDLPPESGGTTAPVSPPPPVTPVPAAKPGVVEAEEDTLTPEEFAQALEQAKKNRSKAGN